jgi:hypothetical protein
MGTTTLTQARGFFLHALELEGRSKGTLALYQRHLREFENWLPSTEVGSRTY